MAGIIASALVKEYPNGVRGVDTVDLRIEDGEFFALLGPSGCGKTTLLRAIAGLEAITAGTLSIGDRDVTHAEPGQRGVAMVFQDYALFPHMDVADNIAYPLRIRGVAQAERRKTAAGIADNLSLAGLLERLPGQLSGGQQQRVALARAVSIRPQVLLLDEPLSNLDARLRLEARTFLKELQRDLGVTTVFVTHDQAEALALADRIAVMRQGRLQQLGSPREVFLRPSNTFVAGFIGSLPMNLIETVATADGVEVGGASLPFPAEAVGKVPAGQAVIWGVRPEYLRWLPQLGGAPSPDVQETGGVRPEYLRWLPQRGGAPSPDAQGTGEDSETGDKNQEKGTLVESGPGFAATVTVVENLGATVLATVTAGSHRLQVAIPEENEPKPGDQGWVRPLVSKTLLFDPTTTLRIGDHP